MENRCIVTCILICIFASNIIIWSFSFHDVTSPTSNSILIERLRGLGISQKENNVSQAISELTSLKSIESESLHNSFNISNGLKSKIQQTENTTEDYVDIKTDVDSNPDIGNHGSFSSLQATDSIYDNITEETGGWNGNTHSWDAPGGSGNYLQVGSGGSSDFGSASGTISLWLKFDDSIGGRFWGQNLDFEVRFLGIDLYLDFGSDNTYYYTHGMTSTNKWYFWAVTWDENADTLYIYEGDEDTQPSQVGYSTSWTESVSGLSPVDNNIMNSRGGSYSVDGHVDDFRYYDTSRSLFAIQNDYNVVLTGSESSLVHYYKFDGDLTDSAGDSDCIEAGSGGGFSTDVSSAFLIGDFGSNLYCWDNDGPSGAYLEVGENGATDFGSTSGTISMWLNFWGDREGRFWGQHNDFEVRFVGDDLYLDLGGIHYYTHGMTSSNKWYFWAITWDENADTLYVYEGDEDTQPSQAAGTTSWTESVNSLSPVVNNIMNSRGGSYFVDGRVDEFRYFNASRSLSDLRSDYNTSLSGSENNLVHYYKFEDDLTDSAGNNDCVKANSYGDFRLGGPALFNFQLDLEIQFTGVYESPDITEKLCIKTGSFKSSEEIGLTYWNGTSWEELSSSLVANSWNNFTVSLTSPTYTIRLSDSIISSDKDQDYWEIDSIFLLVEGPEEVIGDDSGFKWLKEPDEVDLGETYDEWVLNQDLSDDSVPSMATGVILAWVNDKTLIHHTVARGSQDTNDYMNQDSIYCEFEEETWRMQIVKLKDHKFIDTWRQSSYERLYVMGYTIGADPEFRRVASDLGDVTSDSTWHRMKISNVDDSTSGVILFTQSTSDEDATILVRAVGSTDSMTSREWEEYNCGMMFVKLDTNDQFEYYVSSGKSVKFYLIAEVNEAVDWLDTNRVDISATEIGSISRDLDSYVSVPSNASGVILQYESVGSVDYRSGARENGQTWLFPRYDVGGDQWLIAGSSIDDNHSIEITTENLEQDVYIHAITILYDDSSPVFNTYGVDDLGTGEGVFWADVTDSSNVESVTININETYHSMSNNGTYWIYQRSIDNYNDYLEYQIWNATDARGNIQTSPTFTRNHTFFSDLISPTVLEMDYITDQDIFNTNVSDDWGMIDTVIVNVTSRGGVLAIMRNTPSGYVNDTIDLLEGPLYYVIIVNDTRGNTYTSSEGVDYSSGIKPIAINLTLNTDNVTIYSNQILNMTYDYFDADDDSELGTEIRWYNNSVLFPLCNDQESVPSQYLVKGDIWNVTVRPKDGKKFGVLKSSVSIIVRNTPPEISNYAISPSNPTNITDLIASFDYYDADSDTLTFEIEWYKNNINQTDLYNVVAVEAANTTKGEEWYFNFRAYDGENYSDWYNSDFITIENSAPTIVGTPTFNMIDDVDQNDDIYIVYEYNDVDNDSDNQTYLIVKWYKWTELEGVEPQPQKDNKTELTKQDTDIKEVWYYIIRVFDGSVYSGEHESVHVSIAFANTAPEVEYLNITSLNLSNENLTTNDITANYTYSDYDGHIEVGTIITWYLNRSGIESVKHNYTLTQENSVAILTILASETQKGDLWWFSVLPKDGIEYGAEWKNSSKILIRNSLPSATGLTITTNAYNTTNLVAEWNFIDNDTDAGDYESDWNITWYIQGKGRQYHLDSMKTVNAGNTTKGQVWYYIVLVNDSEQWSFPINSSLIGITVKIRNSLPEVSEILITPNPYNVTDLEADWIFNDLDNDPDLRSPEYLNISWYKNGIIQPLLFNKQIIEAENTTKGQYWYYTLQVFDGENWSSDTYISPAVSILNSPPVLSTQITINSSSFTAGNSLSVIYSYNDSDYDPEVGSEIRWYKNKELQSVFNDLTTIGGEYIFKGDIWNVSIRVRDGYSFSEWYHTLGGTTIENSIPEIVDISWNTWEPTNVTDLELLYDYLDIDNDPEVLSKTIIKWYINGEEVQSNQNKSFLPHVLFYRDDKINVTIKPSDGDDYGYLYTSAEITIINAIPTASGYNIKNSTSIRTTDNLVASWTFKDDDNDSQSWYILHWYKFDFDEFEYVLQPELTNLTSIDSGNTTKRDRWYFMVQVGDERDGISIFYQSEPVAILNSQIQINGITINNNNTIIYANENLNVNISFFDLDGDLYFSRSKIFWYINNMYNDSFDNQIIILSSVIRKGQEWYCYYSIADDLGEWSEYKRSQIITISNKPPTITELEYYFNTSVSQVDVDIRTTEFYVEDEDIIVVYAFNDIDSDQDHSRIQWFKDVTSNGSWVEVGAFENLTSIPFQNTTVGESWYCVLTPSDGSNLSTQISSSVIFIESRPVIHDYWYSAIVEGEEANDVNYHFSIEVTDEHSMDELRVEFSFKYFDNFTDLIFISTATNGDFWNISYQVPITEVRKYLGTTVFVTIKIIASVDYNIGAQVIQYHIITQTDYNFTVEDLAAPRVAEELTLFTFDDPNNPSTITFYTGIIEYASEITEVLVYYYFQEVVNDSETLVAGFGAMASQTKEDNYRIASMIYHNISSTGIPTYRVTVPFDHNDTSRNILYYIVTTDSANNTVVAYDILRDDPGKVPQTRYNHVSRGIDPTLVLLIVGITVLIAIFGSVVYVKFIRKPELVGLDKDLVIEKIPSVSESELNHAISDHTLGIVISIFDQWHGPIPLFVEPPILKDNFEKLVELSDRSFSASRFVKNFDEIKLSNFEFDLAPRVSTSSLTFGFSLNRPDKRGGAENITLNILIDKTYESLVTQFIDQLNDIVHEIHVLMDKKPSEKKKVVEKVVKIRKVISSIILAYEGIYGSVEELEIEE